MLTGLSSPKDPSSRNPIRSIDLRVRVPSGLLKIFLSSISLALLWFAASCRHESEEQRLRPRQLRDVPARALAFNFQADVEPPQELTADEVRTLPAIQDDFDKRHPDYALLRTVVSPDKQRALALYNTADEPAQTFRIDLYSADGAFLRNMTPPGLAGGFPESAAWSAASTFIPFVGR